MDTATLASMPDYYERGREARTGILAELRRRERAGRPPPSMRELRKAADCSERQARRYLEDLRDSGLIDWTVRRGRHGAEVTLTDEGRAAADLL